jgi:gliding motility-associated lipoprotein GldH
MRRLRTILFFITLVCAGLIACNRGVVYHDYRTIEDASWHMDSVLHYEVVVDDSISLNNLFINIRNNTEYPYSNLYLFVTTEFPNGHMTRDTIECILADKDGMWLGSGSGKIKDNKIMLQQGLRFPLRGSYHIYLEQAMRKKILIGIEDIGFSIEVYEP